MLVSHERVMNVHSAVFPFSPSSFSLLCQDKCLLLTHPTWSPMYTSVARPWLHF